MTHNIRVAALIWLSAGCYAQSSQPLATPDELGYFRYMLLNLASIDHSQESVQRYEENLLSQFGLSDQEALVIHGAAVTLHSQLLQIRQIQTQLTAGKVSLSDSDRSTLATLGAQREQLIDTLANQILNSVRPSTATSLRAPGHLVAAAIPRATGGQ